jgi:hypothetical protein
LRNLEKRKGDRQLIRVLRIFQGVSLVQVNAKEATTEKKAY